MRSLQSICINPLTTSIRCGTASHRFLASAITLSVPSHHENRFRSFSNYMKRNPHCHLFPHLPHLSSSDPSEQRSLHLLPTLRLTHPSYSPSIASHHPVPPATTSPSRDTASVATYLPHRHVAPPTTRDVHSNIPSTCDETPLDTCRNVTPLRSYVSEEFQYYGFPISNCAIARPNAQQSPAGPRIGRGSKRYSGGAFSKVVNCVKNEGKTDLTDIDGSFDSDFRSSEISQTEKEGRVVAKREKETPPGKFQNVRTLGGRRIDEEV